MVNVDDVQMMMEREESVWEGVKVTATFPPPEMARWTEAQHRHDTILPPSPLTMSNQSPEWQAMTKLVGQFYAKADAGELILFVE